MCLELCVLGLKLPIWTKTISWHSCTPSHAAAAYDDDKDDDDYNDDDDL